MTVLPPSTLRPNDLAMFDRFGVGLELLTVARVYRVYTRYAIVDEAMIREAAVKMNAGATLRRTSAQSEQVGAAT